MKRAILSVAGSGKTTLLVNTLSLDKRSLLLTYTDNNADNLRQSVVEKFGFIPDGVLVSTWFSFVLNFLIKPFVIEQCQHRITRLVFAKDSIPRYLKELSRFMPEEDSVYHSRAFEFVQQYIGGNRILSRICKFFDEVLVDEVQDYAGYDFDFIELLGQSDIDVTIVGDFFQHTFDTSRDGAKDKTLHDDFSVYKKRLGKYYKLDECTLSKSYRCTAEVSLFIKEKLGIAIESHHSHKDENGPVLIADKTEIETIMLNPSCKKLFYQKYYDYRCDGGNWGDCKGLSYENVCVVLNPTTLKCFLTDNLSGLSPKTRNKFYVACTRTKGNLCFIKESDIVSYKKGNGAAPDRRNA